MIPRHRPVSSSVPSSASPRLTTDPGDGPQETVQLRDVTFITHAGEIPYTLEPGDDLTTHDDGYRIAQRRRDSTTEIAIFRPVIAFSVRTRTVTRPKGYTDTLTLPHSPTV